MVQLQAVSQRDVSDGVQSQYILVCTRNSAMQVCVLGSQPQPFAVLSRPSATSLRCALRPRDASHAITLADHTRVKLNAAQLLRRANTTRMAGELSRLCADMSHAEQQSRVIPRT